MTLLALILSVIAIDIAIFERVKRAWGVKDNAFWGVGGFVWYCASTFLVLGYLLSHITISLV